MEAKKWLAKSEVLQDLAEVGNVAGVLEDITTVADKPPAIVLKEDDDYETDFQLRFSHTSEKMEKPDLYSISRMLNMVKEYDEGSNAKEQYPEKNSIVISKLNPQVQEFIPKENKNINTAENDKTIETACFVSNINDKSLCISRDINEEQATLLKKKIAEHAGQNSIKAKRDRNVAIANLVKLYSSPDTKLAQVKENNQEETKLEQLSLENTRKPEPNSLCKSNLDVSREEMQQSIKKVDSWLNGPDPTDTSINSLSSKLFLTEAPTYKRKFKKCITVVTEEKVQPQTVQPETSSRCPQFKGTSKQSELYKKFHEGRLRVQQEKEMKAKEPRNVRETLWDIVENKLKEKEEKRWETTTETKLKSNAGPE